MPLSLTDEQYMHMALAMGRRGLGRTAPNPSVGCVIVKHGRILGRGTTAPGGRPHAEVIALETAGKAAKGATAYVSLEPCAHYGKTPPCTDALKAAGITRVVMATEDNYTLVSGRGREALKKAKIEVTQGVLEKEAQAINSGFISVTQRQRPMVTLKLAVTLDGKIATAKGESRWITGELARAYGHWLRASHDAVLVGSNTAIKDDPILTCRLPGLLDRTPLRIVADTHLDISEHSQLVASAQEVPLWVLTASAPSPKLRKKGVEMTQVVQGKDGRLDLHAMLREIADRGITRLLVEGGAAMAASLLKAEMIDRLVVVSAPKAVGGDGLPAIAALGISTLSSAARFRLESIRKLGPDLAQVYRFEP
jgi:diaminohydroxyphosphoribosylaminopyrimidine deaminase/5-amino-6-(5-phosphoribosylamino)uracil reductase